MKTADFSTLHDVAMEFVDEARFAAGKGDHQNAMLFLKKAYGLEKLFALSIPKDLPYQLSRSIFFRSAASLALECGYFSEAKELCETALAASPHTGIEDELHSILNKAKEQASTKNGHMNIVGMLVSADMPSSQIKVMDRENNRIFIITVPSNTITDVVKRYWENQVNIKAHQDGNGVILLEEIQRAA